MRLVLVFLLLIGLGGILVGCQTYAANSGNNEAVARINVDDFASDPLAYQGPIAIEGVVSFVHPEESTFVIIDLKEYELCGVVTCAIFDIPITVPPDSFQGELPAVKDIVTVYGHVGEPEEGDRFEVSEVRRGRKVILRPVQG